MNHFPWDHGSLSALRAFVPQRTIKAECGKRVWMAACNHLAVVECPECRIALARRAADARRLLDDPATFKTFDQPMPQDLERMTRKMLETTATTYEGILARTKGRAAGLGYLGMPL